MVYLMKSDKLPLELGLHRGTMAPVKLEVENPLEDQYGPFHKRSKLSSSLQKQQQQQQNLGTGGFPVPPLQYNPLDEPSPLGLRLRKSPSLLDLIQMRISQTNGPKVGTPGKKESKGTATSGTSDKLKASNFPASILKIGTWEYKSRYEGDLVAKCYFAKHKLVWEVLDGGLKNKIEIQWSDIMALKANYPEDGPGTLDVMLARQPLFFRETNPQPRKHTLWQATSDFTGGQAIIHRCHYLQCPKGLLGKHFEKLIQCDPRLNFLSQQAEMSLDSPYFESKISVFDDLHEVNDKFDVDTKKNPTIANLREATSTSGAQSSSSRNDIHASGLSEENVRGSPSPCSEMGAHSIEEIRSNELEKSKKFVGWEQKTVPGFHHSMSMSDLVNHIENWITEQKSSNNAVLSNEEKESLEVLEDIRRCLFSDSQQMSASDEKSLMSRVNSMCCLLQKDPAAVQNLPTRADSDQDIIPAGNRIVEPNTGFATPRKFVEDGMGPKAGSSDLSDSNQVPAMSRKDSVGELLLNLPRIASLPHFLFNIPEDSVNEAR